MSDSTFNLITKELGIYGISLMGNDSCSFMEEGKKYKSKIFTKINLLKKKYKKNIEVFKDMVLNISNSISNKNCCCGEKFSDYKVVKVFIESCKEVYKLTKIMSDNCDLYDFIVKNNILSNFRRMLDMDCSVFSKEFMLMMIGTKISLDWIFRRNSKLIYISRLLNFVRLGEARVNKLQIKEAKGFQGPWGNLDLPMKERMFSWDDIAEETSGREKDKERQQRYRKGLENYHRTDKFGEGYFFTEWKNQPYSWENRKWDSPYVTPNSGTWR